MATTAGPVLAQINLVVANMRASVAFYRRLGLAIDDTGPFAAHHLETRTANGMLLELDSAEFAARWNVGTKRSAGSSRAVIGFSLPSRAAVDATYTELTAAGHAGQQPPYDAFWGARYAVVEDPDGNPVGLMSPIDEAYRGVPPAL